MNLICPSCRKQVYLDLSEKFRLLAVGTIKGASVLPVAADFFEVEECDPQYFCKNCKTTFAGERISSLFVICGACEEIVPVTEAVSTGGNIRCRKCANGGALTAKVLEVRELRTTKSVVVAVALKSLK